MRHDSQSKSLKDELDVRFCILEDQGITNLKELIDALKNKQKIEKFWFYRISRESSHNWGQGACSIRPLLPNVVH